MEDTAIRKRKRLLPIEEYMEISIQEGFFREMQSRWTERNRKNEVFQGGGSTYWIFGGDGLEEKQKGRGEDGQHECSSHWKPSNRERRLCSLYSKVQL